MEINWEGIAVFLTALAGFSGIILPIVNSKVKRAEKRYDIDWNAFGVKPTRGRVT